MSLEPPRRLRSVLLCLALFASGSGALAFESLWFHQASTAFGSSVWASSLVLSGFMAGMALGSGLAARWGERLRAPVRVFVGLELTAAVSGMLLVWGLPSLSPWLADWSARFETVPLALNSLRFAAAFVLLLVPATAMGMTLPLLTRAMRGWQPSFGRALGLLYGFNTLGAVFGVWLTEVVLIEQLGVRSAALAAAGFSVAAAALGAWTARGLPVQSSVAEPAPAWRGARWLVASFLSGFAMLALEVFWLRCLTLFLNDTPLAFAIVLAGVLSGLALGSLVASAWLTRTANLASAAGWLAIAAGAFGVGTYSLYARTLQWFFRPDQDATTIVAMAWPLIVPTACASGALFTLLGTGLQRELQGDSAAVGRLAMLNMLGGGVGSLLAGFVLLPALGLEHCLFGTFALYGAIGLLLVRGARLAPLLQLTAAGAVGLSLLLFPRGDMRDVYLESSAKRFMRSEDQLVGVREAIGGTLVHVVHRRHGLELFDHLATNAYAMAANDFAARRYMKLFVYLPVALHPRIRRALLVGYGIGSTAAALSASPELEKLDIADISPDILAMSRQMLAGAKPNPLDDPRVSVHIEDGRHWLAGTGEHYDLITGEPPPPIIAGVVNLYTREYFQLARSKLAPGGMVTHWLPLMNLGASAAKSIIRGFCDAFPDCSLWHGSARNFMLLGTRDASAAGDSAHFTRQWAQPAIRAELERVGFEIPEQLGALFIGDGHYLAELTRDSAALTDDRPKRIQQAGTRDERDALIWQWRDTGKAAERFRTSPWIAKLWPPDLRAQSVRYFETQRLINDLMFPEATPARQLQVLHQVLQGTRLRLPVLLLLHSDPDVQARLARAPDSVRERPEWRADRLAGLLAARDFMAALELLRSTPPDTLAFDDLPDYIEFVVQRSAAGTAPN